MGLETLVFSLGFHFDPKDTPVKLGLKTHVGQEC